VATQTVEFRAATGLTITAKLFSAGSDTEVASVTATEATNRKGTYSAAYTDVPAGEYQLIGLNSGTPVASWWTTLTLSTSTFSTYDKADTRDINTRALDIQSRIPATLDSGNIRASVQNSGIIADAVWEEPYNQHTTAGTFGKLMDILRKSNLTYDGTVNTSITPTTTSFSSNIDETTGAFNHAVLLFTSGNLTGENGVILSYENTDGTITLDEALTEAPADGDEFVIIAASHVHPVTEIQSGLATSAGVTAAFTEIKGATWSSATDTLEDIADTAAGGGVTVAPLQATAPNRVAGTQVVTYINDTSDIGPIAVTDSNGDAVDLSAYTLKVCIEQRDGTVLHNATPTISGASSSQIAWTPNAASVASTGTLRWSLRVVSTGQVLALGDFIVDPAAKIST